MERSKFSYKEKVLQSDSLEATCDVGKLDLLFHVPALNYPWDSCTVLMMGMPTTAGAGIFWALTMHLGTLPALSH